MGKRKQIRDGDGDEGMDDAKTRAGDDSDQVRKSSDSTIRMLTDLHKGNGDCQRGL